MYLNTYSFIALFATWMSADCEFLADGYVAVDHVELDIKEMLELGKKTANTSKIISNSVDVDAMGAGNQCVAAHLHVKFITCRSPLKLKPILTFFSPLQGLKSLPAVSRKL